MSSMKDVFRKVWRGVKMADPYIEMSGALLKNTPIGIILMALDGLIHLAEDKFPDEGNGVVKAQFFTEAGLKVAEIMTGHDVDNPKTRALVARIGTVSVQVKNLMAQVEVYKLEYAEIVKELKEAIESVKAPARPNEP